MHVLTYRGKHLRNCSAWSELRYSRKGHGSRNKTNRFRFALTKRNCSLHYTGLRINHLAGTLNTSVSNTSAQWKRLAPTVKMFPSGGATTLIFIVDGADAVISSVSWNLFVPLDNTSFGVQFLADVNVALYVALERCVADPVVSTWLVLVRRCTWKRQCWTTERKPPGQSRKTKPKPRCPQDPIRSATSLR